MPANPILIVGGGLAGLTLGIGLRRRGVPVALHEAGRYPRHRVCGEFISGRGSEALGRLGLLEEMFHEGARRAETAVFATERSAGPVRALPTPALCLSRYQLDALLARGFQDAGGVLREGTRWNGGEDSEGLVLASGRRRSQTASGAAWLGLKTHARGVELTADLEMHAVPRGYVGLCRLSGDRVNVCGLFRRQPSAASDVAALLRGPAGSLLRRRLGRAVFIENTFCSITALSLRPVHASAGGAPRIGDALTMIPPVTGNGMSMAFESGAICVDPLARYSEGKISWAAARQEIAGATREAFAVRLAWAKWLQWLMLSPLGRSPLFLPILRSRAAWNTIFQKTR